MSKPQAYRTHLGWRNYLGVSVLVHGEATAVAGVVREVNMDSISVAFPGEDELPELRAGDAALVRLTASWLPRAVVTGATLLDRCREDEEELFEFAFSSPDELDGQITPVLHAIFNRRVAPRVAPNEDDDVRVAVRTAAGGAIQGRMHQVSSSGISVAQPPEDALAQRDGEEVRLAFRLPNREEPVRVLARVRNRREGEGTVVVGYEFDPATPEFGRIQGALFGFVLTRAPVRDALPEEKGGADLGDAGSPRRRLA